MRIGTWPGDRPAEAHPAAGPDVAASSGGTRGSGARGNPRESSMTCYRTDLRAYPDPDWSLPRHSIHTIAEVHS
jgi:hypothetical protein